jgi:hypothetical protein
VQLDPGQGAVLLTRHATAVESAEEAAFARMNASRHSETTAVGAAFASTTRVATSVECAAQAPSARYAAAQRLAVELSEDGSIRVNTEPPDARLGHWVHPSLQNLSLAICRPTGRVPHAVKYEGCHGRARRGAAQLICGARDPRGELPGERRHVRRRSCRS